MPSVDDKSYVFFIVASRVYSALSQCMDVCTTKNTPISMATDAPHYVYGRVFVYFIDLQHVPVQRILKNN